MNLANTRTMIAATLTRELDGLTVHAHRPSSVRVRDGWCVLRTLTPLSFQTCQATFDVLIIIGTDEQAAADFLDRTSVALVDAVGEHLGAPVTVVPQSLIIAGTEMLCAAITLILEVD